MKGQRGFTLVELAIVLIIVGILIGAVWKAINLKTQASAKIKLSGFVQEWIAYYCTQDDLVYTSAPDSTRTIENITWRAYTGTDGASGPDVVVICASNNCGNAFGNKELTMVANTDITLDTDGEADAGEDLIVAATSVTISSGNVTSVTEVTSAGTSWGSTHKAMVIYCNKLSK